LINDSQRYRSILNQVRHSCTK